MDPLAGSAWSQPETVAGFAQSSPNPTLMTYAGRADAAHVLDIGCGAGRNAVPLANAGFDVLGTDLSRPMLLAAIGRERQGQLHVALAPMTGLPVRARSVDLIIAHGIWNLARSDSEFRAAVHEAARAAAPHARLFVFTFSRTTLPADVRPVSGENYTFTQFSGHPQIFLTADQLQRELAGAGFMPDPELPLRELNLPPRGLARAGGAPVIFEGGFRFHGA